MFLDYITGKVTIYVLVVKEWMDEAIMLFVAIQLIIFNCVDNHFIKKIISPHSPRVHR